MTPPPGPHFVAYYRVSTEKQGRSGLILEAQHEAVARHAAEQGGAVIAAFKEVESGRRGGRPQLALAMAECRLRRCVLLIAKLDRLVRDAHFLLGLEKAGVEFVAADMPYANRLTIGVMALVAEEEARATSARTKAALASAKARGVKLGSPRLKPGDTATAADARAIWSEQAAGRAEEILPYLDAARMAGAATLQELADALMARGVRTPRGGDRWRPWQVRRILDRARDLSSIPDLPSSQTSKVEDAHAWIGPGATFMEEGEAKRITSVTNGVAYGVGSSGGFWSWPLARVSAAADTGQIQSTAHNKPQRPPTPKRRRLYLSTASNERLTEIRSHSLVTRSGDELPRLVLRTLQALRRGEPVSPPLQLTLLLVTDAGAEAKNLGQSVAFPERMGGRRSKNADAARDTQQLLTQFKAWIEGDGDLGWVDFKWAENLAEAGLQAILHSDLANEDKRGRPQERFHPAENVRACLARQWRKHMRGTYKLADAIREVADREILHSKKVAAAWRNQNPDLVTIDDGDKEALRMRCKRIESAYHRTYRRLPMTVEERRMYRHLAAVHLRSLRRSRQ